jgi:DNA-binding CsgD family transcriptional regulator
MNQIPSSRPLTKREIEVIVLLGHGKNSREVADLLLIERRTVQFHVYNIYRKLGCKNTLSLLQEAIRRGLVIFNSHDEFGHFTETINDVT